MTIALLFTAFVVGLLVGIAGIQYCFRQDGYILTYTQNKTDGKRYFVSVYVGNWRSMTPDEKREAIKGADTAARGLKRG